MVLVEEADQEDPHVEVIQDQEEVPTVVMVDQVV